MGIAKIRGLILRRDMVSVALSLAVVTFARSSLADHYHVPTGSMVPTMTIQDRVVVNKLAAILRLANALDADHMQKVKDIKVRFEDGVFVLAGSVHAELDDDPGGVILATGISAEELGPRIDADPFVRHSVADATILRVEPSKTDERLSFLAAVA